MVALSGPGSEEAARETMMAPSEVVYLAWDRFVPRDIFTGFRLAVSGVSVSKHRLAEQVYSAAFLAAERAGTLHLAVAIRPKQALYANPADRTSPHPYNSLEHRLPRVAKRLCENEGRNEVWCILHDLLRVSRDPFAEANNLVGSILANRGLLEVRRSKQLLVFTKTDLQVPERTAALVADRVSEVQSLLRECQEARPEVWKILIGNICKGISSCQEEPDRYSYGGW